MENKPTISIIIPVFNEKKTLLSVLARVFKQDISGYEKEIIVVNDGSDDGSKEILENAKDQHSFLLINREKNSGKGAALKSGFERSGGEIILIQDADMEYDPEEWLKIIPEFNSPEIQAVYGSRNIDPGRQGYPHYVLGVYVLTSLINILFKSSLTDSYTGCKAFRTNLIKKFRFNAQGFEIEAEITCKLLKQGVKIKEVAIGYFPRKFKDGKKIRYKDGLIGLWTIIKNYIF